MLPHAKVIYPLAAGLAVRLGMLWFVDVQVSHDAATYDLMAVNLVEHGVFSVAEGPPVEPTAFRPPLYPAFLATIYFVAGHHVAAVQAVQIALSLATALLVFRATQRLQPDVGAWALWALVLCPFDAVYSVVLLSENLCSALLVLAFAGWALLEKRAILRWIALGFALGLATLCRDIYIALPPFFALVWQLFGEGARRHRLARAALVVCIALAMIAPWTVRNRVQLGHWIPVSAGRLGFSLWLGAWTTTAGSLGQEVDRDGARVFPDNAYLDERERARVAAAARQERTAQDRVYRDLFVERLRAEPHRVAGRWLVRAPLLWLGTRFDIFELNRQAMPRGAPTWVLAKVALFGINALYVLAAVVGFVWAWRRRSPLRWFAVPVVFSALVYLPLNSFENRYSQPVYPFLCVLAAFAAKAARDAAMDAWRRRRPPR